MGDWTAWSSCSKTCNDQGSRIRSREIIQARRNGGRPCPSEPEERRNCNKDHCPGRCDSKSCLVDARPVSCILFSVDCKLGEWGSWSSTCSCDERFSTRKKIVLRSEQYWGKPCPDRPELRRCEPTGCNGLDAI